MIEFSYGNNNNIGKNRETTIEAPTPGITPVIVPNIPPIRHVMKKNTSITII
jgi:hypothetical protein